MIDPTGVEHVLKFLRDDFGEGLKLMAALDPLAAEMERKAITEFLMDGDTLVADVAFTELEAVGEIAEVRLFASEAAEPGTPGSGVRFATMQLPEPIQKSGEEELTFSFEVQVIPA